MADKLDAMAVGPPRRPGRPKGEGRPGPERLAAAIKSLSLSDELLIPYSPPLEDASIPAVDRVAGAVRELVR